MMNKFYENIILPNSFSKVEQEVDMQALSAIMEGKERKKGKKDCFGSSFGKTFINCQKQCSIYVELLLDLLELTAPRLHYL